MMGSPQLNSYFLALQVGYLFNVAIRRYDQVVYSVQSVRQQRNQFNVQLVVDTR
ncbi:hypothetical protein D3C73_1512060 [compost metagenome]